MSALAKAAPVAVRLGLTHVSVGPIGTCFRAFAWSSATAGPVAVSAGSAYEHAVDHARAYVAVDPASRVLDLPDGPGDLDGRGLVHVDRRPGGRLEVMHESASGGSFALLRDYDKSQLKRALLFALEVLPHYANPKGASRLGRVPL